MILMTSQFVMKRGQEVGALKLVRAVELEARTSPKQKGTLVYFANRKIVKSKGSKKAAPGRTLLFYEGYSNAAAIRAHLKSKSWRAIKARWSTYFEKKHVVGKGITVVGLDLLAGFSRIQS
jgi:quinol monooxygenase YgiN